MAQTIKSIEKQLNDFIIWLANNRSYHEGKLTLDMKDYIATIKSFKVNGIEKPDH